MVKYLHDDALSEITAALCDVRLNSRLLNARLECYTMKRAGTDKKYVTALQVQQQQQQQQEQQELLDRETSVSTAASASVSIAASKGVTQHSCELHLPPWKRQRSVSTGDETMITARRTVKYAKQSKKKNASTFATTRRRSSSLDLPRSSSSTNTNSSSTAAWTVRPIMDLQLVHNRRLLTDLILTLNHAFPDYDFAAASTTDFIWLTPRKAIQYINERLSEVQAILPRLWNAVDQVIDLHNDTALRIYQYVGSDEIAKPSERGVLWSFHYLFVNKHQKRILLFTCMESMVHQYLMIPHHNNQNIDDDEDQVEVEIDVDERKNNSDTNPHNFCRDSDTGSDLENITLPRNKSNQNDDDILDTMQEVDDDDYYYNDDDDDDEDEQESACRGNRDDNDMDNDSDDVSIDFDLDPANAVSGGIPFDSVFVSK